MIDLSIVIVSWNVCKLLNDCLTSIYKNNWQHNLEVFVVDNDSSDQSVKMVRDKFPQVKLISNKTNLGFPKANNQAIRRSAGRHILLLNPDTVVKPKSLDLMIDYLDQHPQTGALGPKLLNPNGTLQRSCLGFPTLGALIMRNLFLEYLWPSNPWSRKYLLNDWNHLNLREVDQPMGAALLVRKTVIDQIGLMDENIYMFFDEVDWCTRIKLADFKIFFFPEAEITHWGGQSIKKWSGFKLSRSWNKSRDYYFRKHFGQLFVAVLWISEAIKLLIIFILMFLLYKTASLML